jgi:hypothetical protein
MLRDGAKNAPPQHERPKFDHVQNPFALRRRVFCAVSKGEELIYEFLSCTEKRLAPFIPDLLSALERFGHISLPIDVRDRLLKISAATIDRLLKTERRDSKKGLCTTRSGAAEI